MKITRSIDAFVEPLLLFSFLIAAGSFNAIAQTSSQTVEPRMNARQEFTLSEEEAAAGIDGKIRIGLSVDKSGAVKNVKVVAGPSWPCGTEPNKELEQLRSSVEEYISAATFSPALKDGKPVDSDIIVTLLLGRTYRQAIKQQAAEEAIRTGAVVPRIVDFGVLQGKALSIPPANYPAAGRAQRMSGLVRVTVLIDERGNVIAAGATEGPFLFQDAARDAACRAIFSPWTMKGQPIMATGTITYNFFLTFRRSRQNY